SDTQRLGDKTHGRSVSAALRLGNHELAPEQLHPVAVLEEAALDQSVVLEPRPLPDADALVRHAVPSCNHATLRRVRRSRSTKRYPARRGAPGAAHRSVERRRHDLLARAEAYPFDMPACCAYPPVDQIFGH